MILLHQPKHETNITARPRRYPHEYKTWLLLLTDECTGTVLDSDQVSIFLTHSLLPAASDYQNHNRYTKDGDILFSCAKDQVICAWFSANGERLGTYHGHQGALWTLDVDPSTTLLASGAADNTVRLWDIRTGKCVKTWNFNTAVKRVDFNEDGTKLLAVTEKRMGFLGTIAVLDVKVDVEAEQNDDRSLVITCDESKATVAAWSYLSRYIIAGHEDGTVSQYDAKVCSLPTLSCPKKVPDQSRQSGELLINEPAHEDGMQVTDLQMSSDRTYFITASKDKTAKVRPPHPALFHSLNH